VLHSRHVGLWRRGAVYQYRVRVPRTLVGVLGKREINRSLKTTSFNDAVRAVRKVAFDIETFFSGVHEGQSAAAGSVPSIGTRERFSSPEFPVPASSSTSEPVSLRAVCDLFLSDPTSSRTQKSALIYRSTFAAIVEIAGAETPMASINRATCREIFGVLQKLPANAKKRFPNMALREIAGFAHCQGVPPMSISNANEYMNKLSGLFNWAIKEEIVDRNPARGLRIADVSAARDKRLPFSPLQLQRIFNAPIYRGCQDDELGYATSGTAMPRRSRFWIPAIALFSGMRLNEICQLHTADVREIEGIWCFVVTAQGADDKQLKTVASDRLVPIHPNLQRMGLIGYAKDRQSGGELRLFPELRADTFGQHSGRFSRWFSRFLVSCDAAAERTCFHSFRHSFRDALREARVDREIGLALGGWTSTGSSASAVADQYGSGFSSKLLSSALSTIEYPRLDLSHLLFDQGAESLNSSSGIAPSAVTHARHLARQRGH
jgi:integrase